MIFTGNNDDTGCISSQPIMRQAYDYWLSKKKGDRLPGRAHINPAEIKDMLPCLALVDVVRDRERLLYRSRLIGTDIARLFGRDVTGRFAHELYSAAYLAQMNKFYGSAVAGKVPIELKCSLEIFRRTMFYERLILPLAGDGQEVDMLLIMLAFDRKFELQIPLQPGISNWKAALGAA